MDREYTRAEQDFVARHIIACGNRFYEQTGVPPTHILVHPHWIETIGTANMTVVGAPLDKESKLTIQFYGWNLVPVERTMPGVTLPLAYAEAK